MKAEYLHDDRDPRLRDYRDVKESRWLRERGVFLVEGRTGVRTLLGAAGFEFRSLLLTESAQAEIAPAWEAFVKRGSGAEPCPAFVVSRQTMERLAGVRFHQGCIAAVRVPPAMQLAEILQSGARKLLVLEDVTDPDNIGACFRNALAFGFDAVLLTPGCAPPLYRKAIRTSMGAILRLPFARLSADLEELVDLRSRGFQLLGLTPDAEALDLEQFRPVWPLALALLLGGEGPGLSARARSMVDLEVRIPMAPRADSLNVATAGAIAMHRIHECETRAASRLPRSEC